MGVPWVILPDIQTTSPSVKCFSYMVHVLYRFRGDLLEIRLNRASGKGTLIAYHVVREV